MLKSKPITIEKGKDKGKTFQITEMPLLEADRWAWTLGHGMLRGGIEMSESDVNKINFNSAGGILEFAKIGLGALGNVDRDTVFMLLDELTEKCIKIVPSSGEPRAVIMGSDISDMATLNMLRMEAIKIHIDFLAQGDDQN